MGRWSGLREDRGGSRDGDERDDKGGIRKLYDGRGGRY
jgi:hypothetical protein